jgi:hypothetical protein
MRERVSATLKITEGQSGRQVALHGLLRKLWPKAVYRWANGTDRAGWRGLKLVQENVGGCAERILKSCRLLATELVQLIKYCKQ